MVKEGRVSKKANEAYTTEETLAFLDSGEEFVEWLFRKQPERLFPKEAIERAAVQSRREYLDNDDDEGQTDGYTDFQGQLEFGEDNATRGGALGSLEEHVRLDVG